MNIHTLKTSLACCLLTAMLLPLTTTPASDEPDILYWVAPMDPGYRRDEPG